MKPIFIFSLPRSGSTLLQRLLATHPDVATVSEPWILLPFFYAGSRRGIVTEYDQTLMSDAFHDLLRVLPGGEGDYDTAVRIAADHLYERLSQGHGHFVDKTPRYALIADRIVRAFPEARCVFLWRNPLAVVSSLVRTWGGGRWNIHHHLVDLFVGLETLVRTYASQDGALAVRYEDLSRADTVKRVFDHVGLDVPDDAGSAVSGVSLSGRMGDHDPRPSIAAPVGAGYPELASPVRRWWCDRYLEWIGEARLSVMGYEMETLRRELRQGARSLRTSPSDLVRMAHGISHARRRQTLFDRPLPAIPPRDD